MINEPIKSANTPLRGYNRPVSAYIVKTPLSSYDDEEYDIIEQTEEDIDPPEDYENIIIEVPPLDYSGNKKIMSSGGSPIGYMIYFGQNNVSTPFLSSEPVRVRFGPSSDPVDVYPTGPSVSNSRVSELANDPGYAAMTYASTSSAPAACAARYSDGDIILKFPYSSSSYNMGVGLVFDSDCSATLSLPDGTEYTNAVIPTPTPTPGTPTPTPGGDETAAPGTSTPFPGTPEMLENIQEINEKVSEVSETIETFLPFVSFFLFVFILFSFFRALLRSKR